MYYSFHFLSQAIASGIREGGQARPDCSMLSFYRLHRHKCVDTVSAGFVFVRAEELCPVAYVNIKLD